MCTIITHTITTNNTTTTIITTVNECIMWLFCCFFAAPDTGMDSEAESSDVVSDAVEVIPLLYT